VHTEANAPGELRVQLVQNDVSALSLSGQVYSSSALELFWDRQPETVVAYRVDGSDGTSVIVDGVSLFVDSLADNTLFMFTVTALDINGNETVNESIELTTAGGNNAVAVVENLRGEVYSSSALEIFWGVSNSPTDITFSVRRDGELVDTTDGRSFFDEGLSAKLRSPIRLSHCLPESLRRSL